MSKQRLIIILGILVLVVIALLFYFFIKKESDPVLDNNLDSTPLSQEEKDAIATESLTSFQPPQNQKSDTEAFKDLNKAPKTPVLDKKTEAEATEDLLNVQAP